MSHATHEDEIGQPASSAPRERGGPTDDAVWAEISTVMRSHPPGAAPPPAMMSGATGTESNGSGRRTENENGIVSDELLQEAVNGPFRAVLAGFPSGYVVSSGKSELGLALTDVAARCFPRTEGVGPPAGDLSRPVRCRPHRLSENQVQTGPLMLGIQTVSSAQPARKFVKGLAQRGQDNELCVSRGVAC